MNSIYTCVVERHDGTLISLAAAVCTIGVYAAFAISSHARRVESGHRRRWMAVSIVASGCTAWATHFIALLAFKPPVRAAFEPVLTLLSLAVGVVIIGLGMIAAARTRSAGRRFGAGVVIAGGIAALHYLGQSAFVVVGSVSWDYALVTLSLLVSAVSAGFATILARRRATRRFGAPLLLVSIAVLHFGGMSAMTITFDPRRSLPPDAISPAILSPIVASVCFGLLALAVLGYKLSLDARRLARRDRQRLRELANLALEGLFVCEDGVIIAANHSCERMTGLGQADLIGRAPESFLPRLDVGALPELEERETDLVGLGDRIVPVRVLRSTITIGEKSQIVLALRDQRERLRTEARLRELAHTDNLTGLLNRLRFSELLSLRLDGAANDQGASALVLDLDRFKTVNDLHGHTTGDALLRHVATRVSAEAGERGSVARLGGDEFAILMRGGSSESDAVDLAAQCVESLSRPFAIGGLVLTISASIGVATARAGETDAAALLQDADTALYAAKVDGGGAFRLYEASLGLKMRERRALEADLRGALAAGQFELHFQPLLEIRSGRITCAEALVRWHHPRRGLVPPAEFIALAEETGLIVELGAWILAEACAEAATWPDRIHVAVNLSPVQFRHHGLIATVASALRGSGLCPDRLELEITEGVLLADEERTLSAMRALRAEGIGISMDDFGTGYSSLNYLRRFPFDKMKVDQSFIRQIPDDAESAAIVRAVLTMGACLGIATVVEGVETAEQLAFTTDGGCDLVQGYLISRPLPAADFLGFVRGHAPTAGRHDEGLRAA